MNCHKTLGPKYGLRDILTVDIRPPAPVVWEVWENYSMDMGGP